MFKARSLAGLLSVSLLLVSSLTGRAYCEEPTESPSGFSAEEIAQLVKDLDANRFTERQAATQKLGKAGIAAIPALSEAAASGSREVTTRSIDVLKRLLKSPDTATQAAAKEALTKLSTSENASAASRAQEALKPKDAAIPPNPFGGGRGGVIIGNGGRIQINGGGIIQIQARAIAGNGQKIQIRNVNGVKDIQVEEKDRKIQIKEDPNKGIEIEVTEKKDGKEVTKKYEAKNLDDLKKQHPAGHKIYEKYNKQGIGGAIQIQGIQIGGGGAPQVLPVKPAVPQKRRVFPVLPQQRVKPAPAERPAAEQKDEAAKAVPAKAVPAEAAQPARAIQQQIPIARPAQLEAARPGRPQVIRNPLTKAPPAAVRQLDIARRILEITRQLEKVAAENDSPELKSAIEQLAELKKILMSPTAELTPGKPGVKPVAQPRAIQAVPLQRARPQAIERKLELRKALPIEIE